MSSAGSGGDETVQFLVRVRGTRRKRTDAILDITGTHLRLTVAEQVQMRRPLSDVKSYHVGSGRLVLFMISESDMMSVISVEMWTREPAVIAERLVAAAGARLATITSG